MKHVNYSEVALNELKLPGADNASVRLLIGAEHAPRFVMLMIELAPGGHTPDHHHPWEEEIFVASGQGTLQTPEGEKNLRAGDVLFLDPDLPHRFSNPGPETIRFVCVIPKRD